MSTYLHGTYVGTDVDGRPVHIGDMVNHTVKGFTNGTVIGGGRTYREEAAVLVNYGTSLDSTGYLNRLSKLRLVTPAATPTPAPDATGDSGIGMVEAPVVQSGIHIDRTLHDGSFVITAPKGSAVAVDVSKNGELRILID